MENTSNAVEYKKLNGYINEGKFQFNLEEQPTISDFQEKIGETITLVGECLLNTRDNFPAKKNKRGEEIGSREYYDNTDTYNGKKIDYIEKHELWDDNDNEWLYCLVYNGRIVKIGMTITSIRARYGSYSCGTARAMEKGSCSTTNYIISECNFAALKNGMNVSIYGLKCPKEKKEVIRFGSKRVCCVSVVRELETMLTSRFLEFYGHLPVLCVQKGK